MNPTIQRKWAGATRFDYELGRGSLRFGDRYCVLGVLCDLHATEHGLKWDPFLSGCPTSLWSYLGAVNCLPTEVAVWAGLPDNNPSVLIWDSHEKRNVRTSLASVSDSGAEPEALARLIEDNL